MTVQATRTTLQADLDSSLGQFKQLNIKVNSERRLKVSGLDAIELDYQGNVAGDRELRFFALTVIDKDRVILVTYTATPESFPKLEPEFRASLASFKLP